jgi:CO/xanthine dehydrogenase FAD-binding subunit
MKPAAFKYLAPRTEDELLASLSEHGGDARILAGGQSLVPMMNFRVVSPAVIIDINRIKSLGFIKHRVGSIEVGALTRHADLEDSTQVRAELPIAGEAIGYLAHRAVRNRGTMGGSLALAYPNAELPLLFTTLGAEMLLRSPRGDRRLAIADFIAGPLDTVLAEDEFIHSARLPVPSLSSGMTFVEVSRRHGDFALAAAAAIVDLDASGTVRLVQAAISGGEGAPSRVQSLEAALTGQMPRADLIEGLAREAVERIDVEGNTHFPGGYRRLLLTTMLQRALETAARRAEGRRVH